MTRFGGILLVLVLCAASCSDGGDETEATVTYPSVASSSTTTVAPTTSYPAAAPSTTSSTTTTSTTAPTTTTTTTTTSAPADTEAPSAPTALYCSPSGGSGEMYLEWDEPPADEEVTTVRVYVRELGGSFERVARVEVGDIELQQAGGRWATVVWPVAFEVPLEAAVTHGDAAGNESGWNPIDVWLTVPGAFADACPSGPPPTPVITRAERSAGSGEVFLTVEVPVPDIADFVVEVDQGGGFVALTTITFQSLGIGEWGIDVATVDWAAPATYRVVARDHHGQVSPAGERDCPTPISPGDVAC